MKGSAFVKMFRMSWNAFMDKWNEDYFDSFDFFRIQYVFGRFYCIPEFCTRNQLERVADAIISKCIYLYLDCVDSGSEGWFTFEFRNVKAGAEIRLKAGECSIGISIKPQKDLPR